MYRYTHVVQFFYLGRKLNGMLETGIFKVFLPENSDNGKVPPVSFVGPDHMAPGKDPEEATKVPYRAVNLELPNFLEAFSMKEDDSVLAFNATGLQVDHEGDSVVAYNVTDLQADYEGDLH